MQNGFEKNSDRCLKLFFIKKNARKSTRRCASKTVEIVETAETARTAHPARTDHFHRVRYL